MCRDVVVVKNAQVSPSKPVLVGATVKVQCAHGYKLVWIMFGSISLVINWKTEDSRGK